jgi:hypothetical protein
MSVAPSKDAMRWSVTGATILHLVSGAPNDAAQDFVVSCVRRSGFVQITLTHSLAGLRAGYLLVTSITDGPHSALYLAQIGPGNGAMPSITLVANDPLFQ